MDGIVQATIYKTITIGHLNHQQIIQSIFFATKKKEYTFKKNVTQLQRLAHMFTLLGPLEIKPRIKYNHTK